MSTNAKDVEPRPLPNRPNLRHLRNQAKDLFKTGAASSITEAQFQIARLYGFASWPKLRTHVDSFEAIGQLKQAIDTKQPSACQNVNDSQSGVTWGSARVRQRRAAYL